MRRFGIVRKITGAQGLSHLLSVKCRPEEAEERSKVLVLSCVWQLFLVATSLPRGKLAFQTLVVMGG